MTKNVNIRRVIGILSILLLVAGFTVPVVFGELYRWKDGDGNWHYSDQPPAESQQDSWWQEKGNVIETTKPLAEDIGRDEAETPDKQKPIDAKCMLWKIEVSGVAPSYILGTIHSEDPRVLDFSPGILKALKRVDTFIMEADVDLNSFSQMSASMIFTDGRTLKSVVGNQLYQRASDALLKYGLPEIAFNQLKPWAVYAILSVPKPKTGQFMDLVLLEKARAQNKKVIGLETVDEQLAIFENMSMNDQVALLKDVLDHLPQIPDMLEKLLTTYAAGDLEEVARLAKKFNGLISDQSAAERLLKQVIDDRNMKMVDRMLPYLLEGDTFIAVGALHLPGKTGILKQLQKRGFKVGRIKPCSN